MLKYNQAAIPEELTEYRMRFDAPNFQQGTTTPLLKIVSTLTQKANDGEGFSVVRLGDGEGACLFFKRQDLKT